MAGRQPPPPKRVELSGKASKVAQAAGEYTDALKETIREIAANPLIGTKLKGEFEGLRRVRVGPYRIVYLFDDTTVRVINIADRKQVYRRR